MLAIPAMRFSLCEARVELGVAGVGVHDGGESVRDGYGKVLGSADHLVDTVLNAVYDVATDDGGFTVTEAEIERFRTRHRSGAVVTLRSGGDLDVDAAGLGRSVRGIVVVGRSAA